jgi:Ni/Co efflux regulator RcnB
MRQTLMAAVVLGLALAGASAQAQPNEGRIQASSASAAPKTQTLQRSTTTPVRLAAADDQVQKRVIVKRKPNETVRRTVTERPNGNTVRRAVTTRPNGNVRVIRKVVRSPRRYHAARPWIAPRGFVYRRFRLGERVPTVLLAAPFFLTSYSLYGLEAAPPGYVWVRDGRDAVLVNRYTGEVVQVRYDVFY